MNMALPRFEDRLLALAIAPLSVIPASLILSPLGLIGSWSEIFESPLLLFISLVTMVVVVFNLILTAYSVTLTYGFIMLYLLQQLGKLNLPYLLVASLLPAGVITLNSWGDIKSDLIFYYLYFGLNIGLSCWYLVIYRVSRRDRQESANHKRLLWIFGGAILLTSLVNVIWSSVLYVSENTPRKPLVYLIPEDYFGPVVVIFDQADGISAIEDTEEFKILIPENGIVKVKGFPDFGTSERFKGMKILYYFVNAKGERTWIPSMKFFITKGYVNMYGYWDEHYQSHEISIHAMLNGKIPEALKNKRLIFFESACSDRRFVPITNKSVDYMPLGPKCGEFVVARYKEREKWPAWMYLHGDGPVHDIRHYDSINTLLNEANDRLHLKKEYFNISHSK